MKVASSGGSELEDAMVGGGDHIPTPLTSASERDNEALRALQAESVIVMAMATFARLRLITKW